MATFVLPFSLIAKVRLGLFFNLRDLRGDLKVRLQRAAFSNGVLSLQHGTACPSSQKYKGQPVPGLGVALLQVEWPLLGPIHSPSLR